MKKNVLKVAAIIMALMFTPSVNAQIDLGNVLGGVLGGSSSSSSAQQGGDLVSTLTSVFSKDKQAKADNIVGTWSYSEPAIVLSGDNFLTSAAYKVAANKIESKLQDYLSQYGIAPGTFTMTFNEDGTFTETLKGKTFNGTWEVADSKLMLTIRGVRALSITTQIDGKDMQLVTDATKLLNLFKSFGASSSNSTIKTAASLLKGAKGMQAGITLRKQ